MRRFGMMGGISLLSGSLAAEREVVREAIERESAVVQPRDHRDRLQWLLGLLPVASDLGVKRCEDTVEVTALARSQRHRAQEQRAQEQYMHHEAAQVARAAKLARRARRHRAELAGRGAREGKG